MILENSDHNLNTSPIRYWDEDLSTGATYIFHIRSPGRGATTPPCSADLVRPMRSCSVTVAKAHPLEYRTWPGRMYTAAVQRADSRRVLFYMDRWTFAWKPIIIFSACVFAAVETERLTRAAIVCFSEDTSGVGDFFHMRSCSWSVRS